MRVPTVRAAELERDLQFAPLADALEPLLRDDETAQGHGRARPEQLGELTAVVPAVGALGG
jgi:hypothetical protein